MYPLKLTPTFKDYIWGGTRLKTDFDKKTELEKVAESWELSCHKDGPCVIANGCYQGLTLEEYILSLEEGECYEANGYLITRQRPKDGKVQIPTGCDTYEVSPDNTGCYIITGKKIVTKIKHLETM